MKKILGYAIACTPAVIPDALSLATQFSYFGAALSGILLMVALLYYRTTSEDRPEKPEVIGVLTLAFLLSSVFSVYRLGSGSTVTADAAPELAEALANAAGTQERLQAILEDAEARLTAVERIASLEAELDALEREKQSIERQAQERERALQAQFREAVQQTQDKIEKAYSEAENAIDVLLDAYAFSASENVPGYIYNDDVSELEKWSRMGVGDLVFNTQPITPEILMGRPRNISVRTKITSESGNEIWSFQDTIYTQNLQNYAPGYWKATLPVGTISFPGYSLSTGAFFFCGEIRDLDSGEQISWNSVEMFELHLEDIKPTFLKWRVV